MVRRSAQAKAIGDRAEQAVLNWLRTHLPAEEAKTVVWVAADGRQPGWDIEYESGGRRVAVEVKGTTGSDFPVVEITANEWEAARALRGDYWLYLVATCTTATPTISRVQDPFGLQTKGALAATPLVWRLART